MNIYDEIRQTTWEQDRELLRESLLDASMNEAVPNMDWLDNAAAAFLEKYAADPLTKNKIYHMILYRRNASKERTKRIRTSSSPLPASLDQARSAFFKKYGEHAVLCTYFKYANDPKERVYAVIQLPHLQAEDEHLCVDELFRPCPPERACYLRLCIYRGNNRKTYNEPILFDTLERPDPINPDPQNIRVQHSNRTDLLKARRHIRYEQRYMGKQAPPGEPEQAPPSSVARHRYTEEELNHMALEGELPAEYTQEPGMEIYKAIDQATKARGEDIQLFRSGAPKGDVL
jgi:hypothetical protein